MRQSDVGWGQIELTRVTCILLMMSVHVNPGELNPSFINDGPAWWLGWLMIDVLGRASVAGLSFISGYLLFRSIDRPLPEIATGKFRSIIVPMLFWNALFVAAILTQAWVTGSQDADVDRLSSDWLAGLTGISGPIANVSLFFLRDLFVSAILVRLFLPIIRWAPVATLLVLLALSVLRLTEPVVFRPSILLFMTAGFVMAHGGRTLLEWAGWPIVVASAAGLVALLAISHLPAADSNAVMIEAYDIAKRALLTMLFIGACGLAATSSAGNRLAHLGKHMFIAYLAHQLLFGLLWGAWTRVVGGPFVASYVVFFLLAPFIAAAFGVAFGTALDGTPSLVQRVLRGKVRKRQRPSLAAA